MSNGNGSRSRAEQAYDYAFTLNRSAPQWYRFRWDTLHLLLTNGIAKVALIIPIAGYVILYSEFFRNLFKYTSALSVGLLNIEQRATFSYLGALILLMGYCMYWIGCPWLLRGKRNVHRFVGDVLFTNDYATLQKTLEESQIYLKDIDVGSLPEARRELLHAIRHQTTFFQGSPPNLGGEVHSAIPRMLRFYYNRQN